MTINDYGDFGTKRYMAPSKRARGFWHGDNALDNIRWCYFFRSPCGQFWQTSTSVAGFATEQEAADAARKALAQKAAA